MANTPNYQTPQAYQAPRPPLMNPQTGQFTPLDDSVSRRVTGLMNQSSPLMQQARTQGIQAANRRGLLNSSMGVQAAQSAAYQTALPIASQEAQQAHQLNVQGLQQESQERIARMNIAAHDRQYAMSAATAMENSYAEMFRTIAQAHELPASARDKYLTHIGAIRDANLNLVEQLYGVDLQWPSAGFGVGGGGAGGTINTPVNPPTAAPGTGLPSGWQTAPWGDMLVMPAGDGRYRDTMGNLYDRYGRRLDRLDYSQGE